MKISSGVEPFDNLVIVRVTSCFHSLFNEYLFINKVGYIKYIRLSFLLFEKLFRWLHYPNFIPVWQLI
jgi:hypothetical protein